MKGLDAVGCSNNYRSDRLMILSQGKKMDLKDLVLVNDANSDKFRTTQRVDVIDYLK